MVILAAISGYGMAIVLVEKKSQWPATVIRPILQKLFNSVYPTLTGMLECATCTSFWTSSVSFLYISMCNDWSHWYYFPIAGFVGIAITWSIIELMNAIDPK